MEIDEEKRGFAIGPVTKQGDFPRNDTFYRTLKEALVAERQRLKGAISYHKKELHGAQLGLKEFDAEFPPIKEKG